ncbi:hypothetical protein EDB83DRAFT_2531244 [Lactarius deliciosus]|nr:hypothetical protein EDB83DRAFT_2531244 [Lactarius deliciosus]
MAIAQPYDLVRAFPRSYPFLPVLRERARMASGAFELDNEAERQALGTWLPNAHDDHLAERPYDRHRTGGSSLPPNALIPNNLSDIHIYMHIPALSLPGLEQVTLILKVIKDDTDADPSTLTDCLKMSGFGAFALTPRKQTITPNLRFTAAPTTILCSPHPRTDHILQYSCEAERLSTVGSSPRRLSSADHLLLPQTYLSVFATWYGNRTLPITDFSASTEAQPFAAARAASGRQEARGGVSSIVQFGSRMSAHARSCARSRTSPCVGTSRRWGILPLLPPVLERVKMVFQC